MQPGSCSGIPLLYVDNSQVSLRTHCIPHPECRFTLRMCSVGLLQVSYKHVQYGAGLLQIYSEDVPLGLRQSDKPQSTFASGAAPNPSLRWLPPFLGLQQGLRAAFPASSNHRKMSWRGILVIAGSSSTQASPSVPGIVCLIPLLQHLCSCCPSLADAEGSPWSLGCFCVCVQQQSTFPI